MLELTDAVGESARMTDKAPNLITSCLSEHVTKDGILLEV